MKPPTRTTAPDKHAVLDLSLRASFVSAHFQQAYVCAVHGDMAGAEAAWAKGRARLERLVQAAGRAQCEAEGEGTA